MVGFCVVCIGDGEGGDIFRVERGWEEVRGRGRIRGGGDLVGLGREKGEKYGIGVWVFLGEIEVESRWKGNGVCGGGGEGLGELMGGRGGGVGCWDGFNGEENLEGGGK